MGPSDSRPHCLPRRYRCHDTREREYSGEDRMASWKLTIAMKSVKECLWLRKGMEMKEIEDQSLKLRANILNLQSKKKNWNKYKRLRFYGHFLAP